MKKTLIILLLLSNIFCSISFAENDCSLSEVIGWKYPDAQFATKEDSTGFQIIKWVSSSPKPTYEQLLNDKAEYLNTQAFHVRRFDSKVLIGDVYADLSAESTLKLAPYTGALQAMMDWDNFTGIKELIDGLVATGVMTEEEKKTIYEDFMKQGIDLTEF